MRSLLLFLSVAVGFIATGCATPAMSPTPGAANATAIGAHCPKPPRIPTKAEATEAAKTAKNLGLLYEIRNRTQVLGYLYGTVHANRYERIALGTRLTVALYRSDILAVELNLRDPAVRKGFAAEVSLAERAFEYTALHLQKIDAMIERYCAPRTLRSKIPSEVYRILLALDTQSKGVYFEYGVENVLFGLAQALNKPVHSLESVEDHLVVRRAFNKSLSDPAQFVSKLESIASGNAADPAIKMVDAWADGDIDAIRQYCAPHCSVLANRVVRDQKMAARIDTLIKSGKKVFAAVGSVHLLGDRSVQKLLEDRGYFVTRVPLSI